MPVKDKRHIEEVAMTRDFDLPAPLTGSAHEIAKQYKDAYKPENADIAGRLVAAGFTEKDLAFTFDVPYKAIESWKRNQPAFKAACLEGKQREKKKLVAKALYAAVGYDYETSKTRTIKDSDGNTTKIEETKFKSHQTANHNLLMFLLCNISHQLGDTEDEKWQSKQKMEIEQNKNVNIQITGEIATEQIRKLAGRLLNEEERPRKQVNSRVVDGVGRT